MKKRARTERREAVREAQKLARSSLKLAALEPGGAPERPIEVTTASVIEPRASSMPCAACGEMGVRIDEHAAVGALRVVRLNCQRCGTRRDLFFRIITTLPS